jgi:hypothetical protein
MSCPPPLAIGSQTKSFVHAQIANLKPRGAVFLPAAPLEDASARMDELPTLRVAILYRGILQATGYRPLSSRSLRGGHRVDVRDAWPAHVAVQAALRTRLPAHIYFVTYHTADANMSAWARERSCGRKFGSGAHSKDRGVLFLHYGGSTQFGTAVRGLAALPQYDYYVLSRVDVVFAACFANLVSMLPLGNSSADEGAAVVAINQELGGYLNDIWFGFPDALRPAMLLALAANGRHGHFLHVLDGPTRVYGTLGGQPHLPVQVLSTRRVTAVAEPNPYYRLSSQPATRRTPSGSASARRTES